MSTYGAMHSYWCMPEKKNNMTDRWTPHHTMHYTCMLHVSCDKQMLFKW